MNSPIMIGIYCFSRPFVCIKYKCFQNSYTQINKTYNLKLNKTYVQVVFQRYSDNNKSRCKARSIMNLLTFGSTVLLSNKDKLFLFKNINKMIDGENPTYLRYFSRL